MTNISPYQRMVTGEPMSTGSAVQVMKLYIRKTFKTNHMVRCAIWLAVIF